MRTKLHWMYLLPLLSLSTALGGCGSELGADPIFSTTVHLTIKPLANETLVASNALNVAWVYRVVAANQVPELGGATMVDCASENAQQSYCIAPSLDVTTRDVRSGQFDVKVGAPLPWVLEAGGRTVTAVIAICEASALGSPECIKYAEGVYVHYTPGQGLFSDVRAGERHPAARPFGFGAGHRKRPGPSAQAVLVQSHHQPLDSSLHHFTTFTTPKTARKLPCHLGGVARWADGPRGPWRRCPPGLCLLT